MRRQKESPPSVQDVTTVATADELKAQMKARIEQDKEAMKTVGRSEKRKIAARIVRHEARIRDIDAEVLSGRKRNPNRPQQQADKIAEYNRLRRKAGLSERANA